MGNERFRVKATVTTGEERQRLFDRQAAQMPIFVEYQHKTSRQIPVLVLVVFQTWIEMEITPYRSKP